MPDLGIYRQSIIEALPPETRHATACTRAVVDIGGQGAANLGGLETQNIAGLAPYDWRF